MSGRFTVRGLVLSERTVGDWDKSLVLLCEGIGRISVWARGAKRIKSPILAACTLFAYADFTLLQRGDRLSVTAAEVQESFFALRRDLSGLALATYVVELCRELCVEEQPEDTLLRMTLNALHAIAGTSAQLPVIKAGFELRALSESGFQPVLEHCVRCGSAEQLHAFTPTHSGMLCANCAGDVADTFSLQPSVLTALRHLCFAELRRIYSFRLPEQVVHELGRICEAYTLATLGRPIKSLSFYHDLIGLEENPDFQPERNRGDK